MNSLDYFDVNSAKELYKLCLSSYTEYASNPDPKNFIFLVFSFNHLREWIAESDYKTLNHKKKKNLQLTKNEQLFFDIYELPEFKIINSLCNRGKHFITKHKSPETLKVYGLNCTHGKVCDSLDQEYYLIDSIDSRDIFIKLIQRYNQWFDNNC